VWQHGQEGGRGSMEMGVNFCIDIFYEGLLTICNYCHFTSSRMFQAGTGSQCSLQ